VFDFAALSQTLYSAVLSDTMDGLGLQSRAMRSFVRPLDDSLVLMGRARTGLFAATYGLREGENPYEIEMALIDHLGPGDVAMLACGGPTERIAPWGELLSTATRARGASGCVTDGLVRDVRHIRAMGLPVFHGGIGPLDTRGRARMIERDTSVEIAGVRVETGDIAFGDVDGVVVIPADRATEVIDKALAKVTMENHTRDELRAGRLLREVYEKYGVL
jgi:4-hydroxy-4-methyl-2-oxoglutarate aldolase